MEQRKAAGICGQIAVYITGGKGGGMTWKIFGYELGWYWKKIYLYLPVHIFLGGLVILPVNFIVISYFGYNPLPLKITLIALSLLLGGCIEWTQNDYSGKEWIDRKVWLLGSVRDVIFYAGSAWVLWI